MHQKTAEVNKARGESLLGETNIFTCIKMYTLSTSLNISSFWDMHAIHMHSRGLVPYILTFSSSSSSRTTEPVYSNKTSLFFPLQQGLSNCMIKFSDSFKFFLNKCDITTNFVFDPAYYHLGTAAKLS